MIYALIIGGVIFSAVVISLCKAAGKADKRHENE